MRTVRVAAIACVLVLSHPALATAPDDTAWRPDVAAAERYAETRQGVIRFAATDESGRLSGHRIRGTAPMASVLKVMFMVAYLRMDPIRGRELRKEDRDLLGPMIRRSDNTAASRVRDLVGPARVNRLARDASMRDFSYHHSPWGLSRTSPRDQASFLFELERYVPDRHEGYARRLLASIVPGQRWGIPKAAPAGWRVHFKGGWGSGTGWVTHQVAFLESGSRRVALAILIQDSPSHAYGIATIRGVASRLLRGL